MKLETIDEIRACLSLERTKFYYFKDRYALMLLSWISGKGRSVRQIKNSPFQKLMHRPMVRQTIHRAGDGYLTPHTLGAYWPARYQCYLLTLGTWGDRESWLRTYNQTSRPGWNLVLQLNFTGQHDAAYNHLIKPGNLDPFKCYSHPIAYGRQHTLAWARMDMDLDTDEALIEEIQNDWIRLAVKSKAALSISETPQNSRQREWPNSVKRLGCGYEKLERYVDTVLEPHIQIWDEAILAAAIWFLREEIGIRRIYYHTYEYGCRLKGITGVRPPRSLYSKLPERFCFQKTRHIPVFLKQQKNKKIHQLLDCPSRQFYMLDFS